VLADRLTADGTTRVLLLEAGGEDSAPEGRMLGGGSSLNAMVYIRGNRADYDGWQANYGATGWSYADVLPYFTRAECNSRLGAPQHGTHGPLHVQDEWPTLVGGRRLPALGAVPPEPHRPHPRVGPPRHGGERTRGRCRIPAAARLSPRADGEVLLSGGSINFPKLLMLSGIGPASHLPEHGIEVALDLPGVGANLHDHPRCR
jgi:choline dehydrogenase